MARITQQQEQWSGFFGKEYTDRNALTVEQMDERFKLQHGISRSELYKLFLRKLERSMRILEVGSNVGNQLICLQKLGFTDLYGIELQAYAVELAKSRTRNINIIQGSGFDIPFKDGWFDLVFTSGVLIHIAPEDTGLVLSEIYRCTNTYILGYEYYADQLTEVLYRGHKNLLWKTDFAQLYLAEFDALELVQEKRLVYIDNVDNTDSMFLLRKTR
ncbi:MAG: pseudaminic acid biosynthesis-associated methylase [Candidatus Hermodarchaeia archaeon]|jgi:pseudaminic acid biosynthesis-associated methylase